MLIPQFGVEEWLNVWEREAVYDIAGSSIASMTLNEIIERCGHTSESFMNLVGQKKMDYGWIEGSPEFKAEVAKLYHHVEPDQILQTNGATGANMIAVYGLIEPGDHVISMYPTYQQLYDIAQSLGAEVDYWHIDEANDWLPHLDDLRQMIRPNTKMIAINNANNPTGAVMDRAYLESLVAIAEEVGAYILSDEVYMPFDETIDVPPIVDLYERGISTNSLSKTYSVPGVRIGWIVANHEVSEIFRKFRDYTMICGGVIDDTIATMVLANKESILQRNAEIVRGNLAIVKDWIAQEPRVSLVPPRYVSTSFIKLDIPMETEAFCIALLKEKGVLLVPGNRFNLPGYARLGYCTNRETLEKGLHELSDFLRQFDA